MTSINQTAPFRYKRRLPALAAALIITALAFSGLNAEIIDYDDSWGKGGFSIVSQNAGGVEIVFSIDKLAVEEVRIAGEAMQQVCLPGCFLPNQAGAPNLPGLTRYIAIPQNSRVAVRLVDFKREVITDIELAPAPPVTVDSDDSPQVIEKDVGIYSSDEYYPDNPVKISEPGKIRGVDVARLGITPFQYNPVKKELVIYRDLRVRVDFSGGDGHFGEDRLRSRFWEPILKHHLLNYESLPQVELNHPPQPGTDETNVEYLIIVPDEPVFIAWADTIKNWRNRQGVITGVTTLSEIGGNDPVLIERYIDNAYHNWSLPPAGVLLLSDFQYSGDPYGITSPLIPSSTVNPDFNSDNVYADVDYDSLPEMAFARITAQDEVDLSTMIGKFIDYEGNPPLDPGFYDHPILAGGWQDERWFILCLEIIYGYFSERLAKHPVREYGIYQGTPGNLWSTNPNTYLILNYFGPGGLRYIPETPQHLTDWGTNAARVNQSINNGGFLIQQRDHAMHQEWWVPDYDIGDMRGLTNDMLPYVISVNCLSGCFVYYQECFAEAFHRMRHGALGVLAATSYSGSFVGDAYVWGMYDYLWQDFDPNYGTDEIGLIDKCPCFASVYGKYYLDVSNWPYNPQWKVDIYNLYHHHGDAFLALYTEVPQPLTVVHNPVLPPNSNGFVIEADEGALIGISHGDSLIGTGIATGEPVMIPIRARAFGDTILVTATKPNYFRYESLVPVEIPTGSIVSFSGLTIDDSLFNSNGLLDYGEEVDLSLAVANYGVDTVNNLSVTITTEDSFVTLIDTFETYGSIFPGDTVIIPDGFRLRAASNILDTHGVHFMHYAAGNDTTWISGFTITAHSPVMEFDNLIVVDTSGNRNRILDPGETASFVITVTNRGSCHLFDLVMELSAADSLISIPNHRMTLDSLAFGDSSLVTFPDIYASLSIIAGDTIDFSLNFSGRRNYSAQSDFPLQIGRLSNGPCGPDSLGYYAFDLYDGIYAPAYNWIEIAPAGGGQGAVWPMGCNTVYTFNLPFNFRFYGRNESEITLSSNGWIAFGRVTVPVPANTQIPYGGYPNNMIACYWDDLDPGHSGQVCHYSDTTYHRLIIEWYQVPHNGIGNPETFQAVIYDPAFYPTPNGDGEIVVQYHTVSSNDSSVTVGIENLSGACGIQYLYNGQYHRNANHLESGFAIKYTTNPTPGGLNLSLRPLTVPVVIPAGGGSFQCDAIIINNTASGINFDAWIETSLPNGNLYGPLLNRNGLNIPANSTLSRRLTQNVPGSAPSGNYLYWGRLGEYRSIIRIEDSFAFTKTGADGSGGEGDTGWLLSGWEEAEHLLAVKQPDSYCLLPPHPNPFNCHSTVSFTLEREGFIELAVYDIAGREVAKLAEGNFAAGRYEVEWTAFAVSSGIYFIRLKAEDFRQTRKVLLVK